MSVFGAASVVAALAAAATGERLPRRTVYLVGFVIGGVPRFVAMAIGIPLWAVLGVFAVGGLGSGFINPIIGAVIYERIPPALLGRVKTLTHRGRLVGDPVRRAAGRRAGDRRRPDRCAVDGRRLLPGRDRAARVARAAQSDVVHHGGVAEPDRRFVTAS